MKKKISNFKLSLSKYKSDIERLKKSYFCKETVVLYQGQKPISSILVLEGSVSLRNNRRIIVNFFAGTLIAYSEFIHQSEVFYDLKIHDSSKIAWVDKNFIDKVSQDISSND